MRKLLTWIALSLLLLLALPSMLEAHPVYQITPTGTPRDTPTPIGTPTTPPPSPTTPPPTTPPPSPTTPSPTTPPPTTPTTASPSPTNTSTNTPTRTPTKTPGSLPWTGLSLNGGLSWLTAGLSAVLLVTLLISVRVLRHRYSRNPEETQTDKD